MNRPSTVLLLAGATLAALVFAAAPPEAPKTAAGSVVPVAVQNFARAESDMYFAKAVAAGAFGELVHHRTPVAIDMQDVIRMNRDTLYSQGVFDGVQPLQVAEGGVQLLVGLGQRVPRLGRLPTNRQNSTRWPPTSRVSR